MNRFLVLGNMINFINDAEPSLKHFNIQYTPVLLIKHENTAEEPI